MSIKDVALQLSACFVAALFLKPALAETSGKEYANIHSVAIISALGDDVNLQHIGLTVFENTFEVLHSNWNIDGIVSQQIRDSLAKRFSTIVIEAAQSKDFQGINAGPFGNAGRDVINSIAKARLTLKVDAYIVFYSQSSPGPSRTLTGITLMNSSSFLGDNLTRLSASYQVAVVDAANGKIIDFGTAKGPKTGIYGHEHPAKMCAPSVWIPKAGQITPFQDAALRSEVVAILKDSLPFALESAKLLPEGSVSRFSGFPDEDGASGLCQY